MDDNAADVSRPDATASVQAALDDLASAYADSRVPELVAAAVEIALERHAGQLRRSGEPYVTHPLTVAATVAHLGFDSTTVAAAVCHDVVEDTDWTVADLARRLGPEVAGIVDGVSKVENLTATTVSETASASLAKFIAAATDDVRVLVVKLADRLHNLRTAEHLPEERRRRSASEALEVFSPLAHRLGLDELRCELEDRAFAVLHPQAYDDVAAALATGAEVRAARARAIVSRIEDVCRQAGVECAVGWRIKHLWSVYTKALRTETDPAALPDLVGIRVVVATVGDCYRALGVVHTACTPVPGRFKDLIAVPRPSGYRSLHTTILVDATPVEVQIRTTEMDLQARFGVAAHYRYKERVTNRRSNVADGDLLEALAAAPSPEAFLDTLRRDLAPPSQVTVLTPAGKPIDLPVGATVIDFAYKIHTDVGHRCAGAKVNGRVVPIRTALRTGDVVEVLLAANPSPSHDWIEHVATSRARDKIRRFLAERAATGGPDLHARTRSDLLAELHDRGVVDAADLDAAVSRLCRMNGAKDLDELVDDMVKRRREPGDLTGLPRRRMRNPTRRRPAPTTTPDLAATITRLVDGIPFVIAPCCRPTALADVSAYVAANRAISVHASTCVHYLSTLRNLPPDELGRVVNLDPAEVRRIVEVVVDDAGSGLVNLFADEGVAVAASTVSRTPPTRWRFEVVADDSSRIEAATSAIAAHPSVRSVLVATPARH